MSVATRTTPSAAHLPPQRIGKYRVLRKLGEGTTAEVFLCHDEFNDRQVAIKRVRAEMLADEQDGHYFERFFAAEAALAGRLEHPNVVQIYDAVPDAEGPYLVMEYVPGSTLREFCTAAHLLPLEQVVEIGFKCAMALGYCYRQGLVHRDVKPANILAVTRSGLVTDVKITDFGSVLNLRADVTQVHRVGSLAYMSPEQIEGSQLDCRSDIYALGTVLYHLITGRPPFDAPSQAAIVQKIFHAEPLPPSQLRAGVSNAVDQVVLKALAKHPDGRFPDWDTFGQALSTLISQQHVPRGDLQSVLDSERFNLLRKLEFFKGFGDAQLWEVVQRARWQRFQLGHALYRRGEEGRTFHIIAKGEVEVVREGRRVATLGAGTSVGEMAYLAPSEELRRHSTDVTVTEPATTISFTPQSMDHLSPGCRHLFHESFIHVLVRRLHAAHEALAHPRRIF